MTITTVRKAAGVKIITICFRFLRKDKINELVVDSDILTNNFARQVTSGLGSNVACWQPVGPP
jgi:hypothetical protein